VYQRMVLAVDISCQTSAGDLFTRVPPGFEPSASLRTEGGNPQLVGRRLIFSTQIVFQGHGRPPETRC
jgi:hypothetical protein